MRPEMKKQTVILLCISKQRNMDKVTVYLETFSCMNATKSLRNTDFNAAVYMVHNIVIYC